MNDYTKTIVICGGCHCPKELCQCQWALPPAPGSDVVDAINDEVCQRCKCCSTIWVECEQCGGEGTYGHDFGEDCCCCADPIDIVECGACGGEGGFKCCIGECDERGKHQNAELCRESANRQQ